MEEQDDFTIAAERAKADWELEKAIDESRSAFVTKDSGEREIYNTGAKRDVRTGKGRFDLISPVALKRLADLYERGAVKYGEHNWKKGIPLSRYLDSAMRHLVACINKEQDEDHAIAVAWNMFSFIHTVEMIKVGTLPKEVDDIGWIKRKV